MSQNASVKVVGAAMSALAYPPCDGWGGQDYFPIDVAATYGASKAARPPNVNGTAQAPFVLPLEGILKVRFLVMRSPSRESFKVLLTSPNGGVDQAVALSDLLVLHVPADGDEITAVKVVGAGDLAYLIAGDVA